jgi:hypothetical protein
VTGPHAGPALRALRSARAIALLLCVAALALTRPASAAAQSEFLVSAGGGGTYYCLIPRCNTGLMLSSGIAYAPLPMLSFGLEGRWHRCFDCKRFFLAEASVQLRSRGRTFAPFVAGGGGLASDPDFIGERGSAHLAVGMWLRPGNDWALQLEVRGRRIEGGDGMGEASVSLARRIRGPSE